MVQLLAAAVVALVIAFRVKLILQITIVRCRIVGAIHVPYRIVERAQRCPIRATTAAGRTANANVRTGHTRGRWRRNTSSRTRSPHRSTAATTTTTTAIIVLDEQLGHNAGRTAVVIAGRCVRRCARRRRRRRLQVQARLLVRMTAAATARHRRRLRANAFRLLQLQRHVAQLFRVWPDLAAVQERRAAREILEEIASAARAGATGRRTAAVVVVAAANARAGTGTGTGRRCHRRCRC